MKKILIVLSLLFQFSAFSRAGAGGTGYIADFSESYAHSSGPGGWKVTDREITNGGLDKINFHESMGVGTSNARMLDCPGSFDIGGFDGMRTLELPTSFNGNIGGRF